MGIGNAVIYFLMYIHLFEIGWSDTKRHGWDLCRWMLCKHQQSFTLILHLNVIRVQLGMRGFRLVQFPMLPFFLASPSYPAAPNRTTSYLQEHAYLCNCNLKSQQANFLGIVFQLMQPAIIPSSIILMGKGFSVADEPEGSFWARVKCTCRIHLRVSKYDAVSG